MKTLTDKKAIQLYIACKYIQMAHLGARAHIEDDYFFEVLHFHFHCDLEYEPLKDINFLKDLSCTISFIINYVHAHDWPIDMNDDIEILQFTLDEMNIVRTWSLTGGLYAFSEGDPQ